MIQQGQEIAGAPARAVSKSHVMGAFVAAASLVFIGCATLMATTASASGIPSKSYSEFGATMPEFRFDDGVKDAFYAVLYNRKKKWLVVDLVDDKYVPYAIGEQDAGESQEDSWNEMLREIGGECRFGIFDFDHEGTHDRATGGDTLLMVAARIHCHTRSGQIDDRKRMNFEIYARDFEDVFPSIEDVLMAYTPADMTYNVARQCVSHPNGCKPAASRW
mmetsp:Transcript_1782/g.5516  ORF Transcript_1782/g.5516 Transcript_1782/m.5516 type:complete len:219 (-) Transcript_1782:486-1142(-)